jgi:hypothetical protein
LLNDEWSKDIAIGVSINDEEFIANANNIVKEAEMTVEEAQAYFSSLGYEPTFVETTIKEPLMGTRTVTKNVQLETIDKGEG